MSSGEANKGMINFTFGRDAKMHGVTIDSTMGSIPGPHLPVEMKMPWLMGTLPSRKMNYERP